MRKTVWDLGVDSEREEEETKWCADCLFFDRYVKLGEQKPVGWVVVHLINLSPLDALGRRGFLPVLFSRGTGWLKGKTAVEIIR